MPLLDSERERLLNVKAKEEAKGKVPIQFEPSKFRETALDTHKTVPVEDWGPPGVGVPPRRNTRTLTNNNARFNPPKLPTSLHTLWSDPDSVLHPRSIVAQGDSLDALRSVFEPTPDQREACLPAVQRRANKASSEWALLDTFQVKMTMDEQMSDLQRRREQQRSQKAGLDVQVRLKQTELAKTANDVARDRFEVEELASTFRKQQARQAEESRRNDKALLDSHCRTAAEQKAEAEREKRETRRLEEEMLQRQMAQMDVEREEAMRRRQRRQEEAIAAFAETEARSEMKRQQRREQKQLDAETVKNLMDKMEREEEMRKSERQQRIEDTERRVTSTSLNEVREKERVKLAEEVRRYEREFEYHRLKEAAAETAQATRREKTVRLIAEDRRRVMMSKREQEKAEREGNIRDKVDMDAKVAAESKMEDTVASERRRRLAETASVNLCQMDSRRERGKVDGVFMSPRERDMNRRLLEAAAQTVGEPRQLNARVY